MNKRVLRVASALNVLIYRLSRGKWLGHFPVPSQNLIRRLRAGMEVVREVEGSQSDTASGRS